MTKVSRIRLVMEVTETRVVDTTVDGLSCHIGLVSRNPRGNLPPVHRDGLGHRVLPQLVRVDDAELQFFDAPQARAGVSEVGGHLGEGRGPGLAGRSVFSRCHDWGVPLGGASFAVALFLLASRFCRTGAVVRIIRLPAAADCRISRGFLVGTLYPELSAVMRELRWDKIEKPMGRSLQERDPVGSVCGGRTALPDFRFA